MSDLHPLVRGAVSTGSLVRSVLIAWSGAAAMAGVFICVGWGLDRLLAGGDVRPPVLVLAICTLVTAVTMLLESTQVASVQARAETTLRTGVMNAVFHGGVITTARAGELLSLATDSVERAAHYRAGFLGPTIGAFTTPLVVLAVLAVTVDPVTAGWLALMIVIVPIVIGVAQRAVGRSGGEHRREQARLTAAFLTSVQGLATLVTARAAERAAAQLAEQGERHRRTLMRVLARNQILILIMDASVTLGIILVAALLAVTRLAAGVLSFGEAVAIVLVAVLVTRPTDGVGAFFYIGIGGRAAQRALSSHLHRPRPVTEVDAPTDEEEPSSVGASIHLDAVTAGWTPGRPVLKDFSLHVEPGEHVALVGPSGIGKSTVSALVQAHLVPTDGMVRVADLSTDATPAHRIRRQLSVVEQRTFLFQGSIADNLRLACQDASETDLWEALTVAGLAHEIREMPRGLDTPVGEHGLTLSGGQSQRLAIARAVLHDAPILILDEPTSQVDLTGEAAFLDSLSGVARDRTVLMIAHRPGAILAADRVVHLGSQEALR